MFRNSKLSRYRGLKILECFCLGIEAFWSFTKRRLAKFNGVPKNFERHLKECEWRYGKPPDQLMADLRRLVAGHRDLLV